MFEQPRATPLVAAQARLDAARTRYRDVLDRLPPVGQGRSISDNLLLAVAVAKRELRDAEAGFNEEVTKAMLRNY